VPARRGVSGPAYRTTILPGCAGRARSVLGVREQHGPRTIPARFRFVDANAAVKLSIPITGSTAQWYAIDGYLPATDAKYDAWYGGNTTGSLSVYAFTVEEFADISPLEGVSSSTIGRLR